MSNANEIRKAINLVEAEAPRASSSRPVEKNVKVNLETLAREVKSKGRYDFNKGFLTFQDILDDPKPFIEKYRKESAKETANLVGWLAGLKADPKYTDKEKYLRQGWESRGFSNGSMILVWFKDNKESLMIFGQSNQMVSEVRDFLKAFRIIR